jgi:aryl-alcohol dehydrogenase-like predicted oxidoreductase
MKTPLFSTKTGLGTAPLGSTPDGPLWWGPQDVETSVATVEAAIDAGVGWIDTAPFYGWGLAERIVGRALRSASHRVAVLSKCGTQRGADGRAYEDASPASIRRGVFESLERLRVDFVDVVQVHDPDPATPIEETWSELMLLVDEGVIGGAGLSNHAVDLMERAIAVGPITVVQQQYSLLHRAPEADGTLAWCAARGIAFLAWSPLGSGFLADGFAIDDLATDDLRRGLGWASPSQHERVQGIQRAQRAVADRHGSTLTATALAWATARVGCHAIVGARTRREAAAVVDLAPLDAADLAVLDEASA